MSLGGTDPRPGWNRSLPEHLPRRTAAPALFAFGVMLLGWGIITMPMVVAVGGAVIFAALLEWIGEIWHDAG
jgi:hypothetical protein